MLNLSKYIARMKAHVEADELVRGIGYMGGRGCFVGCTFAYYDHAIGAEESGIPEWMLRLCDLLHENVGDSFDLGQMAIELLNGFQTCDFDQVRRDLHVFIINRARYRVVGLDLDPSAKVDTLAAIDTIIAAHRDGVDLDTDFGQRWKCDVLDPGAESSMECALFAVQLAYDMQSVWSTVDSMVWLMTSAWLLEKEVDAWIAERRECDIVCRELLKLVLA